MSSPELGIVVYPGAQMAAVLGMTDLFSAAARIPRRGAGRPEPARLRISHWRWQSDGTRPVRIYDTMPDSSGDPAVLIVPPSLTPPISPEDAQPYIGWLRERHGAGTTLGSICLGAFLLAETGLLDGRRATTHWTRECEFQTRFPRVEVDTGHLLIDGGDIITAGGLMAWTDVALRLIDRFLGAATMLDAARTFLLDPPGRQPGRHGLLLPRLGHGDEAILKVQQWLEATEARNMDLASLVARSGLEERTFLRRFRKATGLTTTDYGQRLRVGRARRFLEQKALTADQVAWEVGYADPGAFRKVFQRIVGLSPAEYRRRFNA